MPVPKLRFKDNQRQNYPDWGKKILSNIIYEDLFPTPKPENEYIRMGLHNFNKGTFYEKVPKGKGLSVDTMYVVKKDHLIVNITFAWEGSVTVTTADDDGKLVSHRFPQYAFKCDYSPIFFKYMMFMPKFRFELGLASPGGAGRNRVLNKKQFMKIPVVVPSLPEQEKIANFLSTYDRMIDVQSQRVEAMQTRKKGLLQKIFSQEIRFKDDQGHDYPEWEYGVIGDILKIEHGKNYEEVKNGKIPVLGTGGIIAYTDQYLCNWPCALIGRKGTINKPQYMDTPFWSIDTLFFSKPIGTNCPKFQYYLFQTINWNKYNEASGVPSLTSKTIEKIKIAIPSSREQQKIADFLTAVDTQIEVEEKRLETMKTIKKGLLQQMFI